MKKLKIEWKHLETEERTCLRCLETGKTIDQLIAELKKELKARRIEMIYQETKLPPEEIDQSNLILINGRPLEDWLPGASASANQCLSCCQLIGKEVCCRTVEFEGQTYEAIPEKLIRQAISLALKD